MKTCLAVLLILTTIPLFGQQAFRKGGLYGLVAADGNVLIDPVCDTIYRPVKNFPLFIYHVNKQYHCFVRIGDEQAKWQTFGSYDAIDPEYRDMFRQGIEVAVGSKTGCIFVHFETTGHISSYETLYSITGIDSSGIRYDAIEWNRFNAPRGFATLVQDGKYGLFSERGQLLEPEYDDRPQYCENKYFIVRKGDLEGVVHADSLKGFQTVIAPAYRELEFMGGVLFRTIAKGEELKVINALSGSVLAVKDDRNKVVHNPDDGVSGYYLYCDLETYARGSCDQSDENSMLYISRHFLELPEGLPLPAGIRELYVYDKKGKKILSFEYPEVVYNHHDSGWFSEARWVNERHKKVRYTFYDLPTGEELFTLKAAPQWRMSIDEESVGEKHWNRIEMYHNEHRGSNQTGNGQRVQKGFYNLDTGKYHRFLKI
jgi:hypothetical protein